MAAHENLHAGQFDMAKHDLGKAEEGQGMLNAMRDSHWSADPSPATRDKGWESLSRSTARTLSTWKPGMA